MKTIVVADDNTMVVDTVRAALEGDGYGVLTALDAMQADHASR